MVAFDSECLDDALKHYYKRLFPFKAYCNWLKYGDTGYFQRREFAFVLANGAYRRFVSYIGQMDLEKDVQQLLPHRIELGAVYNYCPQKGRLQATFEAVERELVFDIDLTDYDDVRTCCSKDDMCNKCWKFMIVAIKVIDATLEEDFGFKNRLWVYSGRRGVHCWVCDDVARKLTQNGRSAVVDYLNYFMNVESKKKKVSFNGMYFHPTVEKAVSTVLENFAPLALSQGWFENVESYRPFLALLGSGLQTAVAKDFERRDDAASRIESLIARLLSNGFNGENKLLTEAILQYTYPRLDVNVTKGLNHLLKSPFCIHPKTGKVSVPLDIQTIDEFNPDTVPRIDTLCQEFLCNNQELFNVVGMTDESGNNRKPLHYKRTSLAPYVQFFEEFVRTLQETPSDETVSASGYLDNERQ